MRNPSNSDRAYWALMACREFGKHTGQDTEGELEDIIGDLLANLMHLCDQEEIEFDDMVEDGRMHHTAEYAEENYEKLKKAEGE